MASTKRPFLPFYCSWLNIFYKILISHSLFFFQSENRGSLMVSLCQQPSTGHLHVIILKATGLPPLKAEAPGGLGNMTSYFQTPFATSYLPCKKYLVYIIRYCQLSQPVDILSPSQTHERNLQDNKTI